MPLCKLDMRAPKNVLYKQMIDRANKMWLHAFPPLSDFRVGVTGLTWDGRLYGGVNTENCDISLTMHGEMSALNAMAADGVFEEAKDLSRDIEDVVAAVAVTTERAKNAWPCGHCRDFISGFGQKMDIVVEQENRKLLWRNMAQVLPCAPKAKNLIQLTRSGELAKFSQRPANVAQVDRTTAFKLLETNPLQIKSQITSWDWVDPDLDQSSAYKQLLSFAKRAAGLSWSPYTKRPTGAAVWLYNGNVFTGCRLENVGYTFSTYAELSAINAAIAAGEFKRALENGVNPHDFIRAVAYAPLGQPNTWPNGSSRQCLCEFGLQMDIVVEDSRDEPASATLDQLLPDAFVPDNLSYWTQVQAVSN